MIQGMWPDSWEGATECGPSRTANATSAAARAQQLAQFLDLLLGNKTAANQTVGQQVGDPSRIADIGLTTGNIFDVSGIRQNQLEIAVAENVPDRLPDPM